jgi:hypothetical protein
MPSPLRLPRKPEARTEKVEDLVDRVRRGLVRVPRFQRGLRWTSSNVVELFDSLYRGYPIGSLLFYKQPAEAGRVEVGPLVIEAPETSDAWWVVDGQQRVTALTACLAHPLPLPARPSGQDPYALYFDAGEQRFEPPPTTGKVPSTWVPLPYLLDASQLTEWVFAWEHRTDAELRQVVFEAGTRLREYSIPLYLIETEGSQVARQIFYRINQAGKPLEWTEVHKALFGDEGASPSTLAELSEELGDVGMGRLDEKRLLTCLIALRGKDPTRSLAEHYQRDPEVLRDAVEQALPVLRRVLSFLRRDAGIPHLRLLPKSILLDVLVRFFVLHEEPGPRSRILLARWLWRTVLGAGVYDDRTLRRQGIQAVVSGEEKSVQRLLRLVRKEKPRPPELPANFDARADLSRIALLALAHRGPRDLQQGGRIDVAGLLEAEDKGAFVEIIRSNAAAKRSPANRIFQTKGTPVRRLLEERIRAHGGEDAVLASHLVDAQAAQCLSAGDPEGFLARRAENLTEEMRRFSERRAAWDHNDRPSLDYLLAEAGVEL